MHEETEYYLNEAKNGDFDNAYHRLIELPSHLLPELEDAYRGEDDPEIRALIVEAIWQHRSPASVEFLAVALLDPHPDVWKQALDGLVCLASPETRNVLESAKNGIAGQDATLRDWIEEAIDQIDAGLTADL